MNRASTVGWGQSQRQEPLERGPCRLGVERRSILECHVRAERKRPDALVGVSRPRLRQHGNDGVDGTGPELDQTLERTLERDLGTGIVSGMWIEVGRGAVGRQDQRCRGCLARERGPRPRRSAVDRNRVAYQRRPGHQDDTLQSVPQEGTARVRFLRGRGPGCAAKSGTYDGLRYGAIVLAPRGSHKRSSCRPWSTACVRLTTPSLPMMLLKCVLTVFSLMKSC